jgi:hypothetical protein
MADITANRETVALDELGEEKEDKSSHESIEPPLLAEIGNNTPETPLDDGAWEDDGEPEDADEVAPEVSDLNKVGKSDETMLEVLENGKSPTEAILSSCKANLAGLQAILLRLSNIPDAQRVLPVQSGINYLLATQFTAKILQMADYFPSGITQEELDTILEIFRFSNLHYEACKTTIGTAESTNNWTAALSRDLDTSWKNFCLQILAIPGLLHLPLLNLSLLIGNTIVDQVCPPSP